MIFDSEIELPEGTMQGGFVSVTVSADKMSQAREGAIARAERDLRSVARFRRGSLHWSVRSLEEGEIQGEEVFGVFSFYRQENGLVSAVLLDLAKELSKRDLRICVEQDRVSVIAEDKESFGVTISVEDDEYTVSAESWHGHYADSAQALACFRWLLSPYYRVVSETSENQLAAAWIERYEDEGWRTLEYILFRNPTDPTKWMGGPWLRAYRQQAILRPPAGLMSYLSESRLDGEGLPIGSTLGSWIEEASRSIAVERDWLRADHPYEFDG